MYELTQVSENSYYIQSPAKIGLVRLNDTDVCLIDSGNDKEAGRKVRQILDANGWHLTAIYNTHSNADHIGRQPVPAKPDRLQGLRPRHRVRSHAPPAARARVSLRWAIRRRSCGISFSWRSRATRRS